MTKFSNPAVGENVTAPGSNTTLLDGVDTLAILLLTVSLIPRIGKVCMKYRESNTRTCSEDSQCP